MREGEKWGGTQGERETGGSRQRRREGPKRSVIEEIDEIPSALLIRKKTFKTISKPHFLHLKNHENLDILKMKGDTACLATPR